MSLQHRQFNPLFVLRRAASFLGEATDTLRRRCAGLRWACAAPRRATTPGLCVEAGPAGSAPSG